MKAPGGSLRQSMLAILLLPTLIVYARLADYPVSRAFGALNYPFQLDNVEGYLLDEAVRISQGEPIYSPITERPFLVGNYPPVYQTAFALFVKFGGPSLAWGRIISLSALAGIAFALFLLALQTGRQVVPACLCPLLFLATFACNNWAAYARVDMLSIFFAFAGIVCFLTEDSRRSRVTAIVFFVLAAMTKQSTLAAPAACALFLLLRDWRKGLVFGAVFACAIALLTAMLSAVTLGEYWRHTVVYNANEMYWGQLRLWLIHLARFYHFYIGALIGALLYAGSAAIKAARPISPPPVSLKWEPARRLGFLTIYFLLAACALPTIAKAGAAENYLLEPLAAGAALMGSALSLALHESAKSRAAWAARGFALLMIALLGLQTRWLAAGSLGPIKVRDAMFSRRMAVDNQRAFELYRSIREASGEVLCEDPMFLVLDGRRPPINPFILSQLAREGTWDQTPFLIDIRMRRYALVVTTAEISEAVELPRYTPEMLDVLRANYSFSERFNLGRDGQTYYVYRPRENSPSATRIVLKEHSAPCANRKRIGSAETVLSNV